ncbi:MAG: hypothetical protein HQM00_08360 [Magnetococcales bacterium]|nr:hypothetical protein [Magnetococcales bacterium]
MNKQVVAAALGVLLLSASGTIQAGPTPGTTPEQAPFTKAELDKFLGDYPEFTQWLHKQRAATQAVHTPWILSGMRFDSGFTALLKEKGWKSDRFFYLLNHVNTGLMLAASEKSQAEAEARRAQAQKEQEARNAQAQKEMQESLNASNQRMREQLKAQQDQIRANPYIPPYEKQRILDQMNRTTTASAPTDAAAMAEAAKTQQAQWIAAQEQQLRNNPYLHPMQRQQALAQLQQARNAMQRASTPVKPLDPEAARAEMITLHSTWYENQRKVLNNNPTIPAAQKKAQLEQLQASEQQFKASLVTPAPTPLLPPEEQKLIEANQQRLTELLAGK